MIVQAGRSIDGWTGEGQSGEKLDGPPRALLIIQRSHTQSKIQTFSAPELVLCGTSGLPQANAPPQKLH